MTEKKAVSYRPLKKEEYQALYMLILYNWDAIKQERLYHESVKEKLGDKQSAWNYWEKMINLVNEWGGAPEQLVPPEVVPFNKKGNIGRHDNQRDI